MPNSCNNITLLSAFISDNHNNVNNANDLSHLLKKLTEAINYDQYSKIIASIADELDLTKANLAAKIFAENVINYKLPLSGNLLKFLLSQGDKISTQLKMSDRDIDLTASILLSIPSYQEFFNAGAVDEFCDLALSFQSRLNSGELLLRLSEIEKRYCPHAILRLARKATSSGVIILNSSVYNLITQIYSNVNNIFCVTQETSEADLISIINRHKQFILAQGSTEDSYRNVTNLMFGHYVSEAFVVRTLCDEASHVMHKRAMQEFAYKCHPKYIPYFDLKKALQCNPNKHNFNLQYKERIKKAASALSKNVEIKNPNIDINIIIEILSNAVIYGHFEILESVNAILFELNDLKLLNDIHNAILDTEHNGEKSILSEALNWSEDKRTYTPKTKFIIQALPRIKARYEEFTSTSKSEVESPTKSHYVFKLPLTTPKVLERLNSNDYNLLKLKLHELKDEDLVHPSTELLISNDYLCAFYYLFTSGRYSAIKGDLIYLRNHENSFASAT